MRRRKPIRVSLISCNELTLFDVADRISGTNGTLGTPGTPGTQDGTPWTASAAFLDEELLDVDAIEERAALAADSVPACYLDAWAGRREMATWATGSARRRLNFLQDCRRQILVSDRDGTVKSMKAVANAKAIGRRRKLQQW